jgi:4-amino-4-deoxy-L-arabinose transferase-like glycosyltransferase
LILPKRRQALLYLSLVTVGMILLGISLPVLQFQAGLPIPGGSTNEIESQAMETGASSVAFPWLLQLGLAVGIILLFFLLIIALLKKVNIKRVGLVAGVLVLLFLLFSLLPQAAPGSNIPEPTSPLAQQAPSFDYTIAPTGEPPSSLLVWVTVGLLLASAVFIGGLAARALRRELEPDLLAVEA